MRCDTMKKYEPKRLFNGNSSFCLPLLDVAALFYRMEISLIQLLYLKLNQVKHV